MKPNYKAWRITPVDLATKTNKQRLDHLLGYAIIAPSAHNAQPWKFKTNADKQNICVFLDQNRTLPISDQTQRQAYTSVGAAIQNIIIAAEAYGAKCQLKLTANKQLVATIYIIWPKNWPNPNKKQLELITERQCNHSAYQKHHIDPRILGSPKQLECDGSSLHLTANPEVKQKVGQAAHLAVKNLMTKPFRRELAAWVHPNWTNKYIGMPAAIQGIPGPISAVAKTLIKNLPIQLSQAKKDQKNLTNAPILALVCVTDDDKLHWIQAGRTLQNLLLRVTKTNLNATILGASIEYPQSRGMLQNIFGTSEHAVALVRIGRATKPMPRAPRLPVEHVKQA